MVFMKRIIFIISIILTLHISLLSQIFVSTDGNDQNPGTFIEPYGTIVKAISMVSPGDTIYVRGGIYSISSTIKIDSDLDGTDSSRYHLLAWQNERPLLDFSTQKLGTKGISLRGDYWVIKGFDVKGAGDNGLDINGGSYNIIENCTFFENRDTGLQLGYGASYNRIINCDSYYNADPPDYGDADGFAPKLSVGTGNYFYGCRAWCNCDDGWDGYMRGATNVTTTLENCWTWHNGYLKDGTDPGPKANGNGFKMGGGDDSNADGLMHHFYLSNCVAFQNKHKGFDQNNNVGTMVLLNCTSWANKTANYRIYKPLSEGQSLIVKNCISFEGSVDMGDFAIQEANSWMPSFIVTKEDFISIDPKSASAPRMSNGSLPEIDFLHLAFGSDLIDAGVDVSLPYWGEAPDLGAFESNYTSSIDYAEVPKQFVLKQNYPNPFNPVTSIQYVIPKDNFVCIQVFDIKGNHITDLVNSEKTKGAHTVLFNGSQYGSGVYFYRIIAGDCQATRKMTLLK